jgi:hypothetical protein
VARFVVGHTGSLLARQNAALLLEAADDSLNGLLEVDQLNSGLTVPGGNQGGFVADVRNISAREPLTINDAQPLVSSKPQRRTPRAREDSVSYGCQDGKLVADGSHELLSELQWLQMDVEDGLTPLDVRQIHRHLPIEPSRTWCAR